MVGFGTDASAAGAHSRASAASSRNRCATLITLTRAEVIREGGPPPVHASQVVGIAIIGGYWAVLIVTRWMCIARPNRRFTLARVDDAQFHLEDDDAPPSLLDEARAIATGDLMLGEPIWLRHRRGREHPDEAPAVRTLKRWVERISGPLIWNGSRDLVAWGLLHRVAGEAAGRVTGPALVARLMKAQSQLDDLPERKRVYWSLVLNDLLQGSPHAKLRDEEVAQAILHNLLTELYDARDTKFTNLATQQNKVTWMVFTGLAIMAALVSQGYQDLLMAGAVGGILSRLQRELDRREVPSDYGLSWSVLFLSPVSGALSAWAGVLLLQALQKVNVFDLSSLLPANTDLTAPTGAILGAAVVFGISERMLDRLLRQAEDEIASKPQEAGGTQSIGEQPPRTPAPEPAPTPAPAPAPAA